MKENQNPKAIYLKDYTVPPYLIDKTELEFYLEDTGSRVKSTLHMRRNPEFEGSAIPELELNGVELELLALSINGEKLKEPQYQLMDEGLRLTPTKHQLQDQGFVLELETLIHPENNTALEGLYVSKGMFCTQCEAHGFRRITYYLDRPDVMSEFRVYIEADKKNFPVLLSNGNPVEEGELDNGRHWVRWHDPFPKPCYLFALVAGELECVKDEFVRASGKPVSLQLFVEKHDLDKCQHAMESLKRAMKWDEEVFGREYDLDIYMIVAVNHFNMGAMENKGLNIFNTSCVLAKQETTSDLGFERVESVVAHEYFHNWSGNRVTCRDWFQLSLKEGFTVFRDEEFSSDMGSRTVKRIDDANILRNFQFREDAGPMAHPVRPPSYIEMNNFYTVTVYNKGAEVVRMLHTILGAEQFRKACDLYFERFDGQAVTCDDFVACMEEVSGQDFTAFKRWYSQAGTPQLTVNSRYDSDNKTLELSFSQECPATPGQADKLPFVIPVRLALFSQSGEKLSFQLEEQTRDEYLAVVESENESLLLKDVQEEPLLSLLRNFSAPVKLHYDYSSKDLASLMAHDDDGFNAWDAGQTLYMRALKELVEAFEAEKPFSFNAELEQALETLLDNQSLDFALLSRMLTLPNKSYLAEQYSKINADAVIAAHHYLESEIAARFYQQFHARYLKNTVDEQYRPDAQQIARRSIRNTSLRYLCLTEKPEALALAEQQYRNADNMTEQGSAFRAIVNTRDQAHKALREQVIGDFYEQWQNEALVIDQWFSVQATARDDALLDKVKTLLEHPDYDIKNPNRVRSVLAAFAQNYEYFHAADGSGYQFFAEQIQELNGINPQIAARLVTGLVHWKRYQGERGLLMKAELETLKAMDGISRDVFEIVDRALQE